MLELRNITKHLDDRPVLKHVNMCAKEGKLCAVTGRKDSGRSTLLRIAGGIIRPDAGSVILDDRPVFDNRYSRQKLFYISEVPVLYPGKSIKSQAWFYGKVYNRFDKELFEKICKDFDINPGYRLDEKDRTPAIKAMLATGMCVQPEFILLDDPFISGTNNTDSSVGRLRGIRIEDDDIVDMLKYTASLGIGVIFSAQDKDILPGLTDEQYVLEEM